MSSKHPAICVRGLSKSYTIRRNAAKHTTLADAVVDRIKHPFRRAEKEVFWALRDLNFEVAPGEIVGIIGRNGAGKSTLLKILSRITRPTNGEIELRGRVGSLLEVGTGFHQELTGRENIYLSGTILGMKHREIKEQFDAIVDFAGVEQFLDTPVKRYSSGMYVRLAFAVAAHLNPEILIIDEVLAVGDAEFQAKCLGKMKEVSSDGRTVLFVSHNMAVVNNLCKTAVFLDAGSVSFIGPTDIGINKYLNHYSVSTTELDERKDRQGSGIAKCIRLQIINTSGMPTSSISSGDSVRITIDVESTAIINHVLPGINVSNAVGWRIATFWSGFTGNHISLKAGLNQLELHIKRLDLAPGLYYLAPNIGLEGEALDHVENAAELAVTGPTSWSCSRFPDVVEHGIVFPEFSWRLSFGTPVV